jgi:transcriptional regulator with XRE-family HTH domain
MTQPALVNNPQTIDRLDSVFRLLDWAREMPPATRQRFWRALAECDDQAQSLMLKQVAILKQPGITSAQRQQALDTMSQTLGLNLSGSPSQQHVFAEHLRKIMQAKQISQRDLADRLGCTQPAISQLLNRENRPQKQTILKLAAALGVSPSELWPDIEVAELLDATASFQADNYEMTPAEAKALGPGADRNRAKIAAKSLPPRRHK